MQEHPSWAQYTPKKLSSYWILPMGLHVKCVPLVMRSICSHINSPKFSMERKLFSIQNTSNPLMYGTRWEDHPKSVNFTIFFPRRHLPKCSVHRLKMKVSMSSAIPSENILGCVWKNIFHESKTMSWRFVEGSRIYLRRVTGWLVQVVDSNRWQLNYFQTISRIFRKSPGAHSPIFRNYWRKVP